jgi:hypothetical protein
MKSLDHMLATIDLVYSMMALLYETVLRLKTLGSNVSVILDVIECPLKMTISET